MQHSAMSDVNARIVTPYQGQTTVVLSETLRRQRVARYIILLRPAKHSFRVPAQQTIERKPRDSWQRQMNTVHRYGKICTKQQKLRLYIFPFKFVLCHNALTYILWQMFLYILKQFPLLFIFMFNNYKYKNNIYK